MKIKAIRVVYFSPTHGVKRIAHVMGKALSLFLKADCTFHSYTLPEERDNSFVFGEDELVIWFSPVYAGKTPNKLLPWLKENLKGNSTPAVCVAVYGNRNYDNALAEMKQVCLDNGFMPFAAAALVSSHAFSDRVAKGRPDDNDIKEITGFCNRISERISLIKDKKLSVVNVPGDSSAPYYTPLKEDNTPALFLKAKPVVDAGKCNKCGICTEVCPVGCIKNNDEIIFDGVCIKCQACIKFCPNNALKFTDSDFLLHVRMLEKNYTQPRQNEFFMQ